MCQSPIANIDINKEYDESLGTEDVHYQSFARMAEFFGRDMQAHRHDQYFQMHFLDTGEAYQSWTLLLVGLVTLACLLMLRHLPSGSRERLAERASWRSLGAFLPVLASGVFCFAFFDASILALLPLSRSARPGRERQTRR